MALKSVRAIATGRLIFECRMSMRISIISHHGDDESFVHTVMAVRQSCKFSDLSPETLAMRPSGSGNKKSLLKGSIL
jgi:hypothetical protein